MLYAYVLGPRNKCDVMVGIYFNINCMCCFNSWVVRGGARSLSVLHNVVLVFVRAL